MSGKRTYRRNYGRGHGYFLDGNKVIGVTTAIKGGLPAPALVGWAGRTVAETAAAELDFITEMKERSGEAAVVTYLKESPWRDRDAAARRGTEVHGYAEQLIAGVDVDVPEELQGHVQAYADWLNAWEPDPHVVEGVVLNRKRRYMGTLDLIADIGGERWLLDVKTTRSGVFAETVLQLAAYRYAEAYLTADGAEKPMPAVDRTGVIWVRADGADLIPVDTDQTVFRQFLYCLETARNSDQLKDRIGAPIFPGVAA